MTILPLDISASSDTWRDEDHTRWANRLGRFTRSSLPVTRSRVNPPSGERLRQFWFSPEVSLVPGEELAELRDVRVAPARFSSVSVESESFTETLSRDFLRSAENELSQSPFGLVVVRRDPFDFLGFRRRSVLPRSTLHVASSDSVLPATALFRGILMPCRSGSIWKGIDLLRARNQSRACRFPPIHPISVGSVRF